MTSKQINIKPIENRKSNIFTNNDIKARWYLKAKQIIRNSGGETRRSIEIHEYRTISYENWNMAIEKNFKESKSK